MNKNFPNAKPSDFQTEFGSMQFFIKKYMSTNLGTVQPVEVVEVQDPFVNVKPLIQNIDTQGKIVEIGDNDILYDIPAVRFIGGGSEMQYIPAVGDQGLLIASKMDISKFKTSKQISPIGSYRQFNWADGFFLPLSFGRSSGFIFKNGNSQIEIKPTEINISGGTINLTGNVNLGADNGAGVARIGDTVDLATGKILTGSSTVKAG